MMNDFFYMPAQTPFLAPLYCDDHILLINKPSGLLSVSGRTKHLLDSVERRARIAYGQAFMVHRLDMETSGLILIARHEKALKNLNNQFAKRQVNKTYLAWVEGHMAEQKGHIDLPLATDWPNRPRQHIHPQGRPALTYWQRIRYHDNQSLIALFPFTGRSHQLRVHMAHLGHPIMGDRHYNPRAQKAPIDALKLHAAYLAFCHPETGEALSFSVPADFARHDQTPIFPLISGKNIAATTHSLKIQPFAAPRQVRDDGGFHRSKSEVAPDVDRALYRLAP